MQSEDSQRIVKRFFQALHLVIEARVIRGKQTFTRKHGINRWNMNTVEKNPSSDMFQMAWLAYLVEDFNFSAHWLLTGQGNMFNATANKSAQTVSK